MVISIKEWRKVVWHKSGQVFTNLRIGELAQLGLNKEDMPILFKTTVVKPNQILFTFNNENETTSEEDEVMGNVEVNNDAKELLEKVEEERKIQEKAESPEWKLSDIIDVL